MKEPLLIDKPYQIICEGADDLEFFGRFIRNLGLTDFQVSQARGKDVFKNKIQQIFQLTTVQIEGIILLADTDDAPDQRFIDARKVLQNSNLPTPSNALEIAKGPDGFKSSIIMIPSAIDEGALETLLLDCSDNKTQYADCISNFCAAAAPRTRKLDSDKLKLRLYIAAENVADPGLSLSFWVADANRPFNMNHPSLAWIYNFLVAFRDG